MSIRKYNMRPKRFTFCNLLRFCSFAVKNIFFGHYLHSYDQLYFIFMHQKTVYSCPWKTLIFNQITIIVTDEVATIRAWLYLHDYITVFIDCLHFHIYLKVCLETNTLVREEQMRRLRCIQGVTDQLSPGTFSIYAHTANNFCVTKQTTYFNILSSIDY